MPESADHDQTEPTRPLLYHGGVGSQLETAAEPSERFQWELWA